MEAIMHLDSLKRFNSSCFYLYPFVPETAVLFPEVPLKDFIASRGLGMASPWSQYGVDRKLAGY
jgi:hypothetical protein